MSRILVVDDETDVCEILKFNLEINGYEVDTANSAEEAMQMNLATYDLFLLDVMMYKVSGFTLASHLRKQQETAHTPIISVTAETTFRNLTLTPDTKRATIDNNDLSLTKKEFELLYTLLSTPGKVYSREELLKQIWPDDANILERSVDVNIARMRKKLREYAPHIVSRSGYGYCFDETATE